MFTEMAPTGDLATFSHCVFCSIPLAGDMFRIGCRILLDKTEARTLPASICLNCSEKRGCKWGVTVNAAVVAAFGTRLNNAVTGVFHKHGIIPGFWKRVTQQPQLEQQDIMNLISKAIQGCMHCDSKTGTMQCSACHFARYCDSTCSRADWSKHKTQCKILQTHPIFFAPIPASEADRDREKIIFL
jgi:hypothetical protein